MHGNTVGRWITHLIEFSSELKLFQVFKCFYSQVAIAGRGIYYFSIFDPLVCTVQVVIKSKKHYVWNFGFKKFAILTIVWLVHIANMTVATAICITPMKRREVHDCIAIGYKEINYEYENVVSGYWQHLGTCPEDTHVPCTRNPLHNLRCGRTTWLENWTWFLKSDEPNHSSIIVYTCLLWCIHCQRKYNHGGIERRSYNSLK